MSIITRSCRVPKDRERRDFSAASPGFRKWTPIDAHYIDPRDAHRASIEQSKATKGGVVAPFRLIGTYRSKYPRVPNCPQNDELDERTPAPHTAEPVREAGKES